MVKFLRFLISKRTEIKAEAKFKLSYFEMIFLPLVIAASIFTDNALIVIPSVILILVLQIILNSLLEEEK